MLPSELWLELDRRGLMHPWNREVAKQMVDRIALGVNEAMAEDIPSEKQ